ncbi:MAG: hypothetical protein JNL82_02580 [Myxococcales bacterium]|nr:hypothetical protein [Myxococcales bacterium]
MSSRTGLQGQIDAPDDLASPAPAPLLACGDDVEVDPRRSLAITDQALLQNFTFERVMQQIVTTSAEPGLTKEVLYGRWWDFLNESPGEFPEARHCDDFQIDGQPALGAFPIQCPRPEGILAATDPFFDPNNNPDSYIPIGLFNRLDLAPVDGAHCGEYRVVFAKRSGLFDLNDRNLVIFEASLPNPNPKCGVEGCQAIAEFWLDLADTNNATELRKRLDDFYFGDKFGVGPVIHADNYGPRGAGQIRTNGFMPAPNLWQLHEFKFSHDCGFGPCIRPHAVKDNPHPGLFADDSTVPGAETFKRWLLKQVPNLEVDDVNRFFTTDVGTFMAGQSTAEGTFDIYRQQVGSEFRQQIQDAISTGITADQLLNRLGTLSCAGCHQHNNNFEDADLGGGLNWLPSIGFVQITEEFTDNGPFGPRFGLSDAVLDVFLPHRKTTMENFLKTAACSACESSGIKGTQPLPPSAFAPPGPKAPGLTLGGPPKSH